jgi:hypothetical protein
MLHYFVDMQNKHLRHWLTKPKSDGRRENAENVSLWKKHRFSITDLNSILKKWEPHWFW